MRSSKLDRALIALLIWGFAALGAFAATAHFSEEREEGPAEKPGPPFVYPKKHMQRPLRLV